MPDTSIFDRLNIEQAEAVRSTEGYIRVIAGAGSGKTRALSHRFAYLVTEIGIMPSNILCVTFTNKSANEMRKRIQRLTGDNDTGYISTFHGFCVSVMQEDANAISYPKSFVVLDNSDINQILGTIYEERGLILRDMTFSNARDMIEIRKCKTDTSYYKYMLSMDIAEIKAMYDTADNVRDIIFYGYLYNEKKCFALDYNDLIIFTLYIFATDESIKLKWQKRLEYIMVDEFQDIDELQYRLMRVLCGYHGNLFIVGDSDQTIYTWRGANVAYLLNFAQDFPTAKTILMTKNYRSAPEILAASNSLISKNKNRIKKELIPTRESCGRSVRYHHAATAENEAYFIASEAKKLCEQGVKLSDITVLYRAHYITRELENIFAKEELPYVIYSGTQFFDRVEIKDALSYLRHIAFRDDLSFERIVNVPKRNIGERRMRFLREYAQRNGCSLYSALCKSVSDDLFSGTKAKEFIALIEKYSAMTQSETVSELLTQVLNESGYIKLLRTEGGQTRLDNLAELLQAVHEYEINCGEEHMLESFLTHIALMTNSDAQLEKNAIKLMTVHTAKGLEFPYVFIVGMNEGIFPSKRTETIEGMEEERRLAFVAMTRAKDGLYITDCEGVNHDYSFRYPSRFIFDIGKDSIKYDVELPDDLICSAQTRISQTDAKIVHAVTAAEYSVGDRVLHSVMGAGSIVDIDNELHAYVIEFDDIRTQRKIAFRAKLERIK